LQKTTNGQRETTIGVHFDIHESWYNVNIKIHYFVKILARQLPHVWGQQLRCRLYQWSTLYEFTVYSLASS